MALHTTLLSPFGQFQTIVFDNNKQALGGALMVTVKDIEDMVERVDARLAPLCGSEGFEPFEGLYRVGDSGYVTEAQCRDAFHGEEPWAEAAYMLAGNGMDARLIARYYGTYGVAGLDALNDYAFDVGMADNVFYTEADEEGMA